MSPSNNELEGAVVVSSRMSAIDDELESLYARIALLKAERNSITPISRIPNEILSHIFTMCAEESTTIMGLSWVKILRVCRHWCDLALASPTMWSNIHFYWEPSLQCFMHQIDRSGAAPLKIKIGSLDSHVYTQIILLNAHRIKSLDVGGDAKYALDLMHKMHQYQFPLLQGLFLSYTKGSVVDDPATEMHPSLPPDFFDERMPRLHQLSLAHLDAPWESLSSLRYLSLTGGPDSPARPLSLAALLAVLSSSPGLRTLQLDMMLAPEITDPQCRPVALPQLELLHLRDFLGRCEDVLAHLIFPSTTCVLLYPLGLRAGVLVRDILVTLRKHVRGPNAPIPKMLKMWAPLEDDELHFLTSVYLDTTFPAQLSRDVFFSINAHPDSVPALRQIMVKVLKMLPTQGITHLDAGFAYLTIPTWKTALTLLPSLEAVSMHIDFAGIRFLQAILEVQQVVALRSISVFAIIRPGPEEATIIPFFDALMSVLRVWHDRGTRLDCLRVKDYLNGLTVDKATWAEIGSLVDDLSRD